MLTAFLATFCDVFVLQGNVLLHMFSSSPVSSADAPTVDGDDADAADDADDYNTPMEGSAPIAPMRGMPVTPAQQAQPVSPFSPQDRRIVTAPPEHTTYLLPGPHAGVALPPPTRVHPVDSTLQIDATVAVDAQGGASPSNKRARLDVGDSGAQPSSHHGDVASGSYADPQHAAV